MTRKVCYVSGTRADFGLMQKTLETINASPALALSILVTGTHLSSRHGATLRDIEAAGLPVAGLVEVDLASSSGTSMARNIGEMIIGFTNAMERVRPDIVLLLGDRGEMIAGALAAIHLNIPVAHIHGGELSGTVDELVRHAVSKLSHFHFVATEASRKRLLRMGEREDAVFVTGAPGLDGLADLAQRQRSELAPAAGLDPLLPIALMIFHPVHQSQESAASEVRSVLSALRGRDVQVLALMPNSDSGSDQIRHVLEEFAASPGVSVVTHLPRGAFVSWMAACDIMIGNSSAGIIEAATFGTPVINVGGRQNLRERNANVVDVEPVSASLETAIGEALARKRYTPGNVYGDGHAARRIVALLETLPLNPSTLMKTNAY